MTTNNDSTIQNDDWLLWEFYDEEEYYALNFIDGTYVEEENQINSKREYYLKMIIPDAKLIEGKFPPPETNEELIALENILLNTLEESKVDCKQVYRSLYYGAKRMLFEVNDIEKFEKSVSNWRMTLKDYTLEITEEEPWALYNELLPDEYGWLQIANREVYEQLINAGSDPEKLHTIECVCYGDPEQLKVLESELTEQGGVTISLEDDCLEIGFEMPLDLEEINGLTAFVMDTADELNCEYDGWNAAIVR